MTRCFGFIWKLRTAPAIIDCGCISQPDFPVTKALPIPSLPWKPTPFADGSQSRRRGLRQKAAAMRKSALSTCKTDGSGWYLWVRGFWNMKHRTVNPEQILP